MLPAEHEQGSRWACQPDAPWVRPCVYDAVRPGVGLDAFMEMLKDDPRPRNLMVMARRRVS